jgi:hypothetical protein
MATELLNKIMGRTVEDTVTGCMVWQGVKDHSGYGLIRVDQKTRLVHRVVYEETNGPIPKAPGYHGLCVMHACDRRDCINPAHLSLGTQKANIQDAVRKGRMSSGERNGRAKIPDLYRWTPWVIRAMYPKTRIRTMAKVMGVSLSSVKRLLAGKGVGQ